MSLREVAEEGLLTSKEPHGKIWISVNAYCIKLNADIVSVKEIISEKQLGVFATKQIEQKTFIAEYKGDLLTSEEAEEKQQSYELVGQKMFYQLTVSRKDQQNEPNYI